MQRDSIEELQALIEELWARTRLGKCVQIAREAGDDGSAHIEVVADRYDIVVTERGREVQRTAGLSAHEAARWFLLSMAEGHAQESELQLRSRPSKSSPLPGGIIDDGYSRWNWMALAIETMLRISPDLGEWTAQKYRDILCQAPLEDYEIRNARYPLLPRL